MSEPAPDEGAKERSVVREWAVPAALFVLTFLSMLWVGAAMTLGETAELHELHHGVSFAVPLMAILFAHEMGHYVAGVLHRVDISPPYFIPMPITFLGTLGAVIRMRGAIRSRNALLDVGAAGPLAGMAVAIPVLCYGIATSPIEVLPPRTDASLILEGHSIFYEVLLAAFHGTIPAGSDISLTPTALAGWAG
ncbi:MAG: site-2 protease family protein, partial [Myxococcota bacterium]